MARNARYTVKRSGQRSNRGTWDDIESHLLELPAPRFVYFKYWVLNLYPMMPLQPRFKVIPSLLAHALPHLPVLCRGHSPAPPACLPPRAATRDARRDVRVRVGTGTLDSRCGVSLVTPNYCPSRRILSKGPALAPGSLYWSHVLKGANPTGCGEWLL